MTNKVLLFLLIVFIVLYVLELNGLSIFMLHSLWTLQDSSVLPPPQQQQQNGSAASSGCPACSPADVVAPDVVIPVGSNSLCQLQRLARSLALYDNATETVLGKNVLLLWTSNEPVDEWARDQTAALFAPRTVHVLADITEPDDLEFEFQGWYRQMVNKLRAANYVQTPYYLVLDVKDLFVRRVARRDLFDECNRALVLSTGGLDQLRDPHDWWMLSAINVLWPDNLLVSEARLLGRELGPGVTASVTPRLLHTTSVRELLQFFRRPGGPASFSLMESLCNGATEFMIYTVYTLMNRRNTCFQSVRPFDDAHDPFYVKAWRYLPERALREIRLLLDDNGNDQSRNSTRIHHWNPLIYSVQLGALREQFWDQDNRLNNVSPNDLVVMKQSLFALMQQRYLLFDGETPDTLADCLSGTGPLIEPKKSHCERMNLNNWAAEGFHEKPGFIMGVEAVRNEAYQPVLLPQRKQQQQQPGPPPSRNKGKGTAVPCGGEFPRDVSLFQMGLTDPVTAGGGGSDPAPAYVELVFDVHTYELASSRAGDRLLRESAAALAADNNKNNVETLIVQGLEQGWLTELSDDSLAATFSGSSFRQGCEGRRACSSCHTRGNFTVTIEGVDRGSSSTVDLLCGEGEQDWPALTIPQPELPSAGEQRRRRLITARSMLAGGMGQVTVSPLCWFIECDHDENFDHSEL